MPARGPPAQYTESPSRLRGSVDYAGIIKPKEAAALWNQSSCFSANQSLLRRSVFALNHPPAPPFPSVEVPVNRERNGMGRGETAATLFGTSNFSKKFTGIERGKLPVIY